MYSMFYLLPIAGVLDLIVGDPQWLPHPVRWIGNCIMVFERVLYPQKKSRFMERCAGCVAALLVVAVSMGAALLLLHSAQKLHPFAGFVLTVIIFFYCIAARSLVNEAQKVYRHLAAGDLRGARHALSMIVGRDTEELDEQEIIRATLETTAESITDGIVSPLFYGALFGPVAAVGFKAVSTLDSMIGHMNTKYRYFGTCAARIDDVMNFIPARLTAFIFIPLAGRLCGGDGGRAFTIALRDRLKHDSPNSAHSEAAMAGALGVQLGGGAYYEGTFIKRPFLGDGVHEVTNDMIITACRVVFCVTWLMYVAIIGCGAGYLWLYK